MDSPDFAAIAPLNSKKFGLQYKGWVLGSEFRPEEAGARIGGKERVGHVAFEA